MSVVTKSVNFIYSKSLCYKQFQNLLHYLELNFDDGHYYCDIRWLSVNAMFKLKDKIQQFL